MFRISFLLLALSGILLGVDIAEAQQSRCADCHFANPQADPAPYHLSDWESSAHGRENVGCDKCHGGDAATFESFQAHRGILTSRNPSSPVHRANLPRTCGACHTGPFVAFQDSRHFELLSEGAGDGPTCSTCHGPVAADLFSPRRLERQCLACHGDDGDFAQPAVAVEARVLLDETRNVRALLRQAQSLIGRVDEEARRERLDEQYQQAEVPLIEAVQAGHAFVFEQSRERLQLARERAEVLLNELANPR